MSMLVAIDLFVIVRQQCLVADCARGAGEDGVATGDEHAGLAPLLPALVTVPYTLTFCPT